MLAVAASGLVLLYSRFCISRSSGLIVMNDNARILERA